MSSSDSTIYIPLEQAAEQYGFSGEALREYVEAGLIPAGKLPDGQYVLLKAELDPSLKIKREEFEHLRGQEISAIDAERKYGVDDSSVNSWAKAGHITVLERGWKLMLDEADVAYCAAVYQAKAKLYGGQMTGVRIFDEAGNPYRVKYQDAAARLRVIRRQQKKKSMKKKTDRVKRG